MRILLLEDEQDIRESIAARFRQLGFVVDEAERASEAEGLALAFTFDAFVFDVRLPDGADAGFLLLERLRHLGNTTPVLFLTARDALEDRIKGLALGGDDYLVKPFALAELQARLQALLRRARVVPQNVFEKDGLRLEWNYKRVTYQGSEVKLTAKEYAILELLCQHPGKIYSRSEIADRVWGADFSAETNVVDVYVKNLRRKLGAWAVETVHGSGYRFPL